MLSSKSLQIARRSGLLRNTTQVFRQFASFVPLPEEDEAVNQNEEDEAALSMSGSRKSKWRRSSEPESWVPPAYSEPKRKKKWDQTDEEVNVDKVKHEREVRLVGIFKDIVRWAPQYRNSFKEVPQEQPEPTFGDERLLRPGFSERMQKQIKMALQDIQRIDDGFIVDWADIEDTEASFRSLCRSLQHMCTTCTSLSRYYDRNQEHYVDLAEFLLLELVLLGHDRAKLVESARKTKQVTKEKHLSDVEEETKPDEEGKQLAARIAEETHQQQGGIAGWFSTMVNKITPILPFHKKKEEDPVVKGEVDIEGGTAAAKEPSIEKSTVVALAEAIDGDGKSAPKETKDESTVLAHEQPYLESTHRLFRLVVSSMANAAKAVGSDDNEDDDEGRDTESYENEVGTPQAGPKNSDARRKACEAAARRMLDLLDRMPARWQSPDPAALHFMMETLCYAGSLESARTCNQLYYRTAPQELKYSLVPEAYLEAVRFEMDKTKRREIVEEAVDVLHQLWNSRLPSHRVERIMHCSIVLNCISMGDMARLPGMCHAAEILAKRAIGSASYAKFVGNLVAEEPKIDVMSLPMVNYLTQIYASSQVDDKVDVSKQMLRYMTLDGDRGSRLSNAFPSVDTCNAVLLALLKRYDRNVWNKLFVRNDLDYAMNLMDYMCQKSDSSCLPDSTTHDLMFRLLDAAKPENAGEIAEDLLSKMEIARLFSEEKTSFITVSTYHHIMGYLLQMAKSPCSQNAGRCPCERALSLLDKMEVQSTPMVLSDKALTLIDLQNLYDVSLRPLRQTYALVLKICSETSNPDDKEKAFDVAIEVHRRMKKQGLAAGEDTTSLLTTVCSFLPEESEKRKRIEEELRKEEEEVRMHDILKSA